MSKLFWLCVLLNFLISVPCHAERQIKFSGYTWNVKTASELTGPGPNYFSDSMDNVWLDENGLLHLKITARDGKWQCAEVMTERTLGYGRYLFQIVGRPDQFEKNAVLGLFTYDYTARDEHFREIDIEFSRWGDAAMSTNSQFVIQPFDVPGNMHRFQTVLTGTYTTHIIDWTPEKIHFESLHDHAMFPVDINHIIDLWTYYGDGIPETNNEKVHINLWLYRGAAPSDNRESEIVISRFIFIPYCGDSTYNMSTETLHIPCLVVDGFNDPEMRYEVELGPPYKIENIRLKK